MWKLHILCKLSSPSSRHCFHLLKLLSKWKQCWQHPLALRSTLRGSQGTKMLYLSFILFCCADPVNNIINTLCWVYLFEFCKLIKTQLNVLIRTANEIICILLKLMFNIAYPTVCVCVFCVVAYYVPESIYTWLQFVLYLFLC